MECHYDYWIAPTNMWIYDTGCSHSVFASYGWCMFAEFALGCDEKGWMIKKDKKITSYLMAIEACPIHSCFIYVMILASEILTVFQLYYMACEGTM